MDVITYSHLKLTARFASCAMGIHAFFGTEGNAAIFIIIVVWFSCRIYRIISSIKGLIDGLVQDCSISSVLTREILQSCTKPSNSMHKQPLPRISTHRWIDASLYPASDLHWGRILQLGYQPHKEHLLGHKNQSKWCHHQNGLLQHSYRPHFRNVGWKVSLHKAVWDVSQEPSLLHHRNQSRWNICR